MGCQMVLNGIPNDFEATKNVCDIPHYFEATENVCDTLCDRPIRDQFILRVRIRIRSKPFHQGT